MRCLLSLVRATIRGHAQKKQLICPRSDLLCIKFYTIDPLENMYNGTEEVPDNVIWNVAPLRRKYSNKFERWDADTLCT